MAITITVAAAEVDATLTDFPVAVDLSAMPASFWSSVHREGHNIRIFDDNPTRVAVDLLDIAVGDETGWLVFLAPSLSSSVDTEFTLDLDGTYQGPGDTYGREAVWADYEAVTHLGSGPINRATGAFNRYLHSGTVSNVEAFEQTAISTDDIADTVSHDGVATDGSFYYGFDETAIRKYNLSWVLQTENTTAVTDAGLGADEIGPGAVYDGVIYCGIAETTTPRMWIAKYSATDLSFIDAFEITDLGGVGTGINVQALYYNPDDDLLYATRYDGAGDDAILKYDPVAETLDSTITMSASLVNMQGLVKWRDAFWISQDDGPAGADHRVRYVKLDGTIADYIPMVWDSIVIQNLDVAPGGNGIIVSRNAAGVDDVLTMEPLGHDLGLGGGVDITVTGSRRVVVDFASAGALGTSWMAGWSFRTDDNTQDVLLDLINASDASLLAAVNDNGNMLGVFDSANSWIYASPNLDPATDGTFYRAHFYYDATTERAIYWDGSNKNTDSTITAAGGTADGIVVGPIAGGSQIGGAFAYFRSIPTNVDAWVAAEYSMIATNGTFLSISGAIDPDPAPAQPTLTITNVTATGVSATTSVFSGSTLGGSHIQTDWRITKLSDSTVVTISSTSDLTSIVNAGSSVPLDTAANVYTLEARHGEST